MTSVSPFLPPLSHFPSLTSFISSKEGEKAGGQRMEPTQLKQLTIFRGFGALLGLGLHKEVVERQPGGVRGKEWRPEED